LERDTDNEQLCNGLSNHFYKSWVFKKNKNMKKVILIIVLLSCMLINSCKKSEIEPTCTYKNAVEDLNWLKNMVSDFNKTAGMLGCPGRHIMLVNSGFYNNRNVFTVNVGLCGQAVKPRIYSCEGTLLCEDTPNCNEILQKISNDKQIYTSQR
jgi:hypothetical protein